MASRRRRIVLASGNVTCLWDGSPSLYATSLGYEWRTSANRSGQPHLFSGQKSSQPQMLAVSRKCVAGVRNSPRPRLYGTVLFGLPQMFHPYM